MTRTEKLKSDLQRLERQYVDRHWQIAQLRFVKDAMEISMVLCMLAGGTFLLTYPALFIASGLLAVAQVAVRRMALSCVIQIKKDLEIEIRSIQNLHCRLGLTYHDEVF